MKAAVSVRLCSSVMQVVSSDDEMLSLELGTLCKRYPDVSHDQLLCLLLLRGDLARAEAVCCAVLTFLRPEFCRKKGRWTMFLR